MLILEPGVDQPFCLLVFHDSLRQNLISARPRATGNSKGPPWSPKDPFACPGIPRPK